MLDQRLVRENPSLIVEGLKRRGVNLDLGLLKEDTDKLKELENNRNSLQAEGNTIGKEVGKRIKNGCNPNSNEIKLLRKKGNQIKQKVMLIEENEKSLSQQIKQ